MHYFCPHVHGMHIINPHRCHTNHVLTLKCITHIWTSGGLSVDWFYNLLRTRHYYHQALSYVNQCICMAKHISSTVFYAVTGHLGGGLQPPEPPSKSTHAH